MLTSLQGLDIAARLAVEGFVAGIHKSPYHGVSVEFAEHREYAAGDDLRHVDWKVWSKTDKLYLKQYEQETNLISYVLLDSSESMAYASEGHVSKWQYAQLVAASLSYLILQQQDAVGLATFDHRVQRYLRPSGQPSHLKDLIQVMTTTPTARKTDLAVIFHDLAERFKKRGLVILVSDLFDDVSRVLAGLRHFRHRRHDLIVFHILDPAELDFPFRQTTLFKGLEDLGQVLVEPVSLRRAYQEEIQTFCADLRRGCQTNNIDYVQIRTDQELDVVLQHYLATRAARLSRLR